jgi:hypothetical protein
LTFSSQGFFRCIHYSVISGRAAITAAWWNTAPR